MAVDVSVTSSKETIMKYKCALLFLPFIATMVVGKPGIAQTEGTVVPAEQVPKVVPEWFRKEKYDAKQIPQGWKAAIPLGAAITTSQSSGRIEITSVKLMCYVPGKSGKQTIVSGVETIGAGLYSINPWFGNNDAHERAKISRASDGAVIIDVPPNRILHWWTEKRGTVSQGTKNCSASAVVRGSTNVIASVGGDWWKSATAQWAGLNVNNREIGIGNWYKLNNSQWQTIRLKEPK